MTSSTPLPTKSQPPLPPRQTLPTMYDLPSDNPEEPGLPDEFHFLQPLLLYLTFQPTTWSPELVYAAADLNLYYDLTHPQWYKRPDWFGAVGVPRFYEGQDLRLSYVTWQERANPFVVVELLSPGTEEEDSGKTTRKVDQPPTKWEVYEKILQIPYYVIFSRYTSEIQAFQLVGGRYQSINLINETIPMPNLGLSLGLWQGLFRDADRLWLRWMTLEGELIPLPSEEAVDAKQEAADAKQKAADAEIEAVDAKQEAADAKQKAANAEIEAADAKQKAANAEIEAADAKQKAADAEKETAEAQLRANRLAERLRELGVNPDEIES
ncbi:MAG: Uma2 family endonuclease [Symploca sp. SIO2E6]|nr:Uma2 family endonuclease [Symploca sp. SIO2E6]